MHCGWLGVTRNCSFGKTHYNLTWMRSSWRSWRRWWVDDGTWFATEGMGWGSVLCNLTTRCNIPLDAGSSHKGMCGNSTNDATLGAVYLCAPRGGVWQGLSPPPLTWSKQRPREWRWGVGGWSGGSAMRLLTTLTARRRLFQDDSN